jgi:hypothetical protein
VEVAHVRYFSVEPEVAGELGERSKIRHVDGRVQVDRLHYEFHGWLGDCLIESTPCFIITKEAEHVLRVASATGARFDVVEISRSEEFDKLQPDCELPAFSWLIVDGRVAEDDFGLSPGLVLVISERVLHLLRQVGLKHALVKALAGQ